MRYSRSAPYFFGSRAQGTAQVQGDSARFLGHKIADPEGRTDGVFAEWVWDGEILTVKNDRYGFFPLFYYAKGSDVGVSPSISSLIAAGADAELNDAGVALFLRLGQFIGNDTAFRHIHCLPPGATLIWNSDGLQVTGTYENVRENKSISRSDAKHRYIELFAIAIRKRLPSSARFAVSLTGGRDSRHILFELCRTGFKPQLCGTVVQYPDDAAVAGLLANRLGVRHVVVTQDENFFDAEIKKNELSSFGVDQGTWPFALHDLFVKEQVDTVYDGIGGDVLSAGLFLTPTRDNLFRSGHLPSIVNDLLPDTEELLKTLLTPECHQRWGRELASTRMGEVVKQHLHAHNPVTSFFFWNRTRRKIALTPYALLSGPFTVFAPYLDHELFDFLVSLPTGLIMDHDFHTETIHLGYPVWNQIRFEDKHVPEPDFRTQYARFARRLAEEVGIWPNSDWLQTRVLSARLLTSRLSARFAGSSAWYFRPALWLLQLESLVRSSRRIAPAAEANL